MKTAVAKLLKGFIRLWMLLCLLHAMGQLHTTAQARELGLGENWRVTQGNKTTTKPYLHFSWREFTTNADQLEVEYAKEFSLAESDLSRSSALILPQNWANLRVTLNGQTILEENPGSGALSQIFAKRIIKVPAQVLSNQNKLQITARGARIRGGFRSSLVLLTSDSETRARAGLSNLLTNDSHVFFIFLSVMVSLLAFKFSRLDNIDGDALVYLGRSSLAIIPHHLLATGVFQHIFHAESAAFTLNLAAQLYCWPNILAFFAGQDPKHKDKIRKIADFAKQKRLGFASIPIVILSALFLPFEAVALTSYVFFFGSISAALFLLARIEKKRHALPFLFSLLLILTTLYSDFMFSDSYFLGYGVAISSITGLYMMVQRYDRAFTHGQSFAQIVRQSLPSSVHSRIQSLVESGADLPAIRAATSGNSILTIVLIDICDWGVMNNREQTGIPAGIVRAARAMAFSHFEAIFAKHQLELIKTSGDNLKFCGGLLREHPNKEAHLADQALSGVKELLESLDALSADLRAAQLPLIKIKVSVTMGTADYGIESYNSRLQFDIQGHTVNAAYRLESAMGDEFYKAHGKNVALVANTVIRPCEDLNLRKRFPEPITITDKHGFAYDCFVGTQHERQLKVEDFAQALFGLFSHQSAPAQTRAPTHGREGDSADDHSKETRETPNTSLEGRFTGKRRDRRKRLYISDGFGVSITAGASNWNAWAIDLSTNGAGLAVPLDEGGPTGLQPGETIALGFRLKNQNVEVKARVASVRRVTLAGKLYERLGVEILPEERFATERKFPRIPVSDFFSPIAQCPDPYNRNRLLHFRIDDVSAEGLCARASARNAGLIPGMRLTLSMLAPGSHKINIPVIVRHVTPTDGEDRIRLGFHVESNLHKFQQTLGQYLLDFQGNRFTAQELARLGFALEGYREALTFKYPECQEEWDQLWELRLQKWNPEIGASGDISARDRFDDHSRQIICKVSERVVACARLVFNDGNRSKVEHLSYGAEMPEDILNSRFVEAGRVVVHPDFRGDDVFRGIITELGRVTKQTGHQYIIQSCTERLFPVYRRFGFRKLGSYQLSGTDWILAALDIDRVMSGKDVTAAGWALSGSDIAEALRDTTGLHAGAIGSIKTQLLDLQKPLILNRYRAMKRRHAQSKGQAPRSRAG